MFAVTYQAASIFLGTQRLPRFLFSLLSWWSRRARTSQGAVAALGHDEAIARGGRVRVDAADALPGCDHVANLGGGLLDVAVADLAHHITQWPTNWRMSCARTRPPPALTAPLPRHLSAGRDRTNEQPRITTRTPLSKSSTAPLLLLDASPRWRGTEFDATHHNQYRRQIDPVADPHGCRRFHPVAYTPFFSPSFTAPDYRRSSAHHAALR